MRPDWASGPEWEGWETVEIPSRIGPTMHRTHGGLEFIVHKGGDLGFCHPYGNGYIPLESPDHARRAAEAIIKEMCEPEEVECICDNPRSNPLNCPVCSEETEP